MFHDKRVFPRDPCIIPIKFAHPASQKNLDGTLLNISQGGIYFETDQFDKLQEGDSLIVFYNNWNPLDLDFNHYFSCRVKWTETRDNKSHPSICVGAEFNDS